jgi:lysozyme family protein
MIGNFPACVQFSLVQEGGFTDTLDDGEIATNHGITMDELSAVLGRQATVDDVRNLTTAQAEAIYLPRYWCPISGDKLPTGVDLCVFDFGINCGPETSAKRLQALIGTEIDGIIGPVTLARLATHNTAMVISTLTISHQAFYRSLPGYSEFGLGWISRTRRCQMASLAMLKEHT